MGAGLACSSKYIHLNGDVGGGINCKVSFLPSVKFIM